MKSNNKLNSRRKYACAKKKGKKFGRIERKWQSNIKGEALKTIRKENQFTTQKGRETDGNQGEAKKREQDKKNEPE